MKNGIKTVLNENIKHILVYNQNVKEQKSLITG